jgi:hypothetical protein
MKIFIIETVRKARSKKRKKVNEVKQAAQRKYDAGHLYNYLHDWQ